MIVCDLAGDITPLLTLDSETLRERLYTPRSELGDAAPVPIKLVHINKCPVLAPEKTLLAENAERLGLDRQRCLDNLAQLRHHHAVRDKVVSLFADAPPFPRASDVDSQLYDGFFSDADRQAMQIIRATQPQNLPPWICVSTMNALRRCCSATAPATIRPRWMRPNGNAGNSIAGRC
ncbi:Exodeoxyribonuclease I [Edwardsiella tarda]|nr:Exodeoxyribonuclease I [Edwardsiella tarda]